MTSSSKRQVHTVFKRDFEDGHTQNNHPSPNTIEVNLHTNQDLGQKRESVTSITNQVQSEILPANISHEVKKFFFEYKKALELQDQEVVRPIKVDELASRLAKLYEQVRQIIDWKEEHLVRRTAIERILKRKLMSEIYGLGLISNKLKPKEIAEPMIMELMRSGHFSNGDISKDKIPYVERALYRTICLLSHTDYSENNQSLSIKEKVKFYNWVIGTAACEIEEIIEPSLRQNALLDLMTECVFDRIKLIPANTLSQEEAYVQTYVATHRTLFNVDDSLITHNLMKLRYPQWFTYKKPLIHQYAEKIEDIISEIKRDLNHPHASSFYSVCESYDAVYLIIGDVFEDLSHEYEDFSQSAAVLANQELFCEKVKKAYTKRHKTLKKRLFRSAIYSTLSIFVAGSVSFVLFEGPIAKWLANREFNFFTLLVDLMVPTALMFILVAIIRPPAEENYYKLKQEILKILYSGHKPDIYEIKLNKKKRYLLNSIFAIFSILAGGVSMFAIYWVFKIANVPWTSIYIDTVNVAMVVFAAMVIRQKSKEITIRERGSFAEFAVDLFYIPLAKIGQWFSQKWREYNFVSVFFTALIDAPFSHLISIVENWRNFLKDKKSEIH